MPVSRLGALLLPALLLAQAPEERRAVKEAVRAHNQACMESHFNFGNVFTLPGRNGERQTKLDLLIPPGDAPHRISFLGEALGGDLSLSLTGPEGTLEAKAEGRRLNLVINPRLAAGKHTLSLSVTKGAWGMADLSVKGPVLLEAQLDPAKYTECPPAAGFHVPYFLYCPRELKHPKLLVVPNNTGFATEDPELLRASAAQEAERQSALADRLGCPLLVPTFLRPQQGKSNLYLHALSRESLTTGVEAWRRVDLQLIAMIEDARRRLAPQAKLDSRVLMWGFSAAGSFVNRFALLHPERVLGAAIGAPGWPLAPLPTVEGERLTYPVGVADLEPLTGTRFDLAACRKPSFLFLLGDQDANDPVKFRDSFSAEDEALIFRRFGATPVARWRTAEALYQGQGLDAQFRLYPGLGHAFGGMEQDLETFLRGCLLKASKP